MAISSVSRLLRCGVGAALALVLASPAVAEQVRTLPAAKPAPNNERRVALVIGNGAYKSSPLRNPVNDARAVAGALSQSGFAVRLLEDGTQAGMRRAIRAFGDELLKGGTGLFYYAGHGMQVRGRNFLIPVNADIEREDEVEDAAVDANFVLSKMDSAKNALNILILDACRNNPFQRSFRSSAQGLAQMDAPSGTLIAFATAPGSVAADGEGENGIYTKHLLEQIRRPGLPVEQVFKQVRIGVTKETRDRQVPWESSSLKGEFFFLSLPPGMAEEERRRLQRDEIERAVGDAVKQAEARAAREQEARERAMAREREELQARMEQMVRDALAKQLEQIARAKGVRVDELARETPKATAAPALVASTTPVPAGRRETQPRVGDRWTYRGRDLDYGHKKYEFEVEVVAVSDGGILEETRFGTGERLQWVHSVEDRLIGLGEGLAMFAPYLGTLRSDAGSAQWAAIDTHAIGLCESSMVICRSRGRVEGVERLTVAGATVDATRIVISHGRESRVESTPYIQQRGTREYVFWYAPAMRRIVKMRSTGHGGIESNTEYELVSYKLN